MTLEDALSRPTISVTDAGAVFYGLSRNGSYDAAKRGDFETIRLGGRIVVPVAPIAAKLGLRMNLSGQKGIAA
ncbi:MULTISPECIES: DNA-binding protein [unclassified Mesorhizobium]|uniref:DNA-binding protein n=1 Tax=unclassified Mesorhizobium TaxID=325217 RepID=UPI000F762781|nr:MULTISPECIES: DNA-binding protein [unclassified Mesorhizobium]AZO63027.1 DNA-binding protein [Mesorhizobium sp. M1A.F.Ca.IN.022.06.1.1]MCT2578591.1 DNA-binding protein [Mesorhizobium sp. P13.3]MDF3167394.1 DNA-binding protein [Mesorhizobium sp. P16.1]MDF3179076.1 DNA-binding protein [Mesorhizobium sp. P17.1]MDF3184306.1 DNA-binding protein [Mesorhizobium sp. ICCV3110.1]